MKLQALAIAPLLTLLASSMAIAANPDHVQRLLKTNQCPMCDLSGANLENANLFGANLVNANLTGTNLTGANLGSANLSDANMTGAKLNNAYLYQATLENTNLSQSDLSGAYLKDAILQDVNLTDAALQGVNVSRTNLTGVRLKGANLTGANLSYATLSGFRSRDRSQQATLIMQMFGLASLRYGAACYNPSSSEIESMRQAGIDLVLADLSGSKLSGANLKGAVLLSSDLSGADLSGADLTETLLVCSNLKNAVLDGANLKNARLERAVLDGASLKDIKNADLEGTYRTALEMQAVPAQTDARQYVGSMSRAQQAYYLEYSKFALQLPELGLGIKSDTDFYQYRIFAYRDRTKAVMVAAIPKKKGFKTYVGIVNTGREKQSNSVLTFATQCESQQAVPLIPKMPAALPSTGAAGCPSGFTTIRRN